MNAEAIKIANKLNRKRESINRLKDRDGFWRVRSGNDFLTYHGRKLITDATYLIDDLKEIGAWDWYVEKFNRGNDFDATDLAA